MKKGSLFVIILSLVFVLLLIQFVFALTCTPGSYNTTHFCDITGEFEGLKDDYDSCLNDYECKGDSCVYGGRTECTGDEFLVSVDCSDIPQVAGISNEIICGGMKGCIWNETSEDCEKGQCSNWNYDSVSCRDANCTWTISIDEHYCEAEYAVIKQRGNFLQNFWIKIVLFFSGTFDNISDFFSSTPKTYQISEITNLEADYDAEHDAVVLTWGKATATEITASVIAPLTGQAIGSLGITGRFVEDICMGSPIGYGDCSDYEVEIESCTWGCSSVAPVICKDGPSFDCISDPEGDAEMVEAHTCVKKTCEDFTTQSECGAVTYQGILGCEWIEHICGDSILVTGEECDDGDTVSDDGCNSTCQVEINYNCLGEECVLITTGTGNGACQDKGKICTAIDHSCILAGLDVTWTQDGTGCSTPITPTGGCIYRAACVVDSTQHLCGNGVMNGNELCDDGGTSPGDGCSSTCQVESEYVCSKGEPSYCRSATITPAENLLENPGFEDVPTSFWIAAGDAGTGITSEKFYGDIDPQETGHSAKLVHDTQTTEKSWWSKKIPISITQPTEFKFSGWYYLQEGDRARIVLFVYNESTPDSNHYPHSAAGKGDDGYWQAYEGAWGTSKGGWYKLEETASVPGRFKELLIRLDIRRGSHTRGIVYFDDISLTMVEAVTPAGECIGIATSCDGINNLHLHSSERATICTTQIGCEWDYNIDECDNDTDVAGVRACAEFIDDVTGCGTLTTGQHGCYWGEELPGAVDVDEYIIYRSPVSAMDLLGKAFPSEDIGYEEISINTSSELGCEDGTCEFIDTNLPDGTYYYIVASMLDDKIYNYSNEANVSIERVPIFPSITIIYPTSTPRTKSTPIRELKYSVLGTNLHSCWWSNNSGVWNSSTQTCGTNWTTLTSNEGSNTWTVYVKNRDGDEASDSVTFTYSPEAMPPTVEIYPLEKNTYYAGEIIEFTANITDEDAEIDNWNLSSSIIGEILTGSSSGEVEFEISVLDNGLIQGTHTITLEAEDTDGFKGSDSFDIIIKNENCTDGSDNDGDGITDGLDNDCPVVDPISIESVSSLGEVKTYRKMMVDCEYSTDSPYSVSACIMLNLSGRKLVCESLNVDEGSKTVEFKGCVVGSQAEENAELLCYVSNECNAVEGKREKPRAINITKFSICKYGGVGEGNLTLYLNEPGNNDAFDAGDEINIEAEVKNKEDVSQSSLDFIVEAQLYDIDAGSKLANATSEAVSITYLERETFNLNLSIPQDVVLGNDHRLYYKAYVEGDEDEICHSDSIGLVLQEEFCTDDDEDGYCEENDCDDDDEDVNPGANESLYCTDNIDNDCDDLIDEDDSDCDIPSSQVIVIAVGGSNDAGALTTLGVQRLMHRASRLDFKIAGASHSALVKTITSDSVTLTISSSPFDVSLTSGQTKDVDTDGDAIEDLRIKLNEIIGGAADITFRSIYIPSTGNGNGDGERDGDEEEEGMGIGWIIFIFILVIGIAVVIALIYLRKKREGGTRSPGPGMRGPAPPFRRPPRRRPPPQQLMRRPGPPRPTQRPAQPRPAGPPQRLR